MEVEIETWYEIESSMAKADDWFRLGTTTHDAVDSAKERIKELQGIASFEYRVVKVEHKREVLGALEG